MKSVAKLQMYQILGIRRDLRCLAIYRKSLANSRVKAQK